MDTTFIERFKSLCSSDITPSPNYHGNQSLECTNIISCLVLLISDRIKYTLFDWICCYEQWKKLHINRV